MKLYAGTSGWAYKEWRGSFYPDGMKEADMLPYYSAVFPTVEMNSTFYRLPNEKRLRDWMSQVPDGFSFALKASRSITHMRRLKDAADATTYLFSITSHLGPSLGPILFGLPPNLKCDVDRLRSFLELVPAGARVAFEFRNDSWHQEEVYELLRARNIALCVSEDDESGDPLVATADWGYLRLRRSAYDAAALTAWRARLSAQSWTDAWVFFKHEDSATGPRLAREFMALPA